MRMEFRLSKLGWRIDGKIFCLVDKVDAGKRKPKDEQRTRAGPTSKQILHMQDAIHYLRRTKVLASYPGSHL